MQCVPSHTASCWCGLSVSFRYFIGMSTVSNSVAMATVTWQTDIPLTSSTTTLTYKSVFNPLLRSPSQTHVL